MKILLGHKVGMTQIWNDKGKLIPVSVIQAEPNKIIKQGEATLVGVGVAGKTKRPQLKTAEALDSKKGIWLKSAEGEEGDTLTVEQFEIGEAITISGVTKGKGFAGVMKRHNFHGGPASHGSDHHRTPGSIGAQRPQHVIKGQKMPGHMGNVNLTVQGNKVVSINKAENLLMVSGAIPGPARGRVVVRAK